MKYAVFLCLALAANASFAQFPATANLSAVPEKLKKDAAVIVHSEDIRFEVSGLEEATLKEHKLFTVLNEDGQKALFFNEYSNKYMVLTDVEIRIYDQNGKQIEKHRQKEMTTTAVGEGLVEEGAVTYLRVKPPAYPVTVEYNCEKKIKSTLAIPDFRFIEEKEAVLQASYTAVIPAGMKLRYKARHCSLTPVVTEGEKTTTYQWSVHNLPAIAEQEGSISWRDRFPYVNIVADQFSHYGFRGDMSSWKSFGAWINELYQGLDGLSPERQQFFQQLVGSAPDEKEKVRRIYRYLQENFRYVSIQLGIGGLRPFSASFTDEKKYGDCKALSNYMRAALETVGIRSYVAIINAGYNEEPVDSDFPANNFNHVVLCVPGKDSLWLECTSAMAEFNKLGTFTENRNALLITENGGVLVPTPRSDARANTLTTHTTVTVENDLSAESETSLQATGELGELVTEIGKESHDDQKQSLISFFGYRQPDDFQLEGIEKNAARLKMNFQKLSDFAAGAKVFFTPRLQKILPRRLPQAGGRTADYYFHFPFSQTDTTVFRFPAGMRPEVLPTAKECSTAYSDYGFKSWYKENENAVYTVTTLVLKKHKIPSVAFAAVKSFFEEVGEFDSQKLVMKKSPAAESEKKAF